MHRITVTVAVTSAWAILSPVQAATESPQLDAATRKQISTLAVPFVPNTGQWDPAIAFATQTFAGSLAVSADGRLTYRLVGGGRSAGSTELSETLVDHRGHAVASVPSGVNAQTAQGRLGQYISDGTDDEKRLAMSVAPLNPDTEAALAKAAKEASPELRVAALSRLLAVDKRRAEALRALHEVANAKPSSESEAHARAAALTALANAGDASVATALTQALKSPELAPRWRAARGLTQLGQYANAATALADDANLRSDIACGILARENAAR